jgi:hypothetical protein
MLVKVLGGIDAISGLIMIIGAGVKIPVPILIIFGVILLIKAIGLGQLKDFPSWIDFCGGIIFILSILFIIPGVICIIAGILLLQKGIFSFL